MKGVRRLLTPVRLGVAGLLLVGSVVVAGICLALYLSEARQIEGRLRDREAARTDLLAHLLGKDLASAIGDLRMLESGNAFQSFLTGGGAADLARAKGRAVFFSNLRPEYDQIRYIDERGQEILRVDRGGLIAPPDKLRNKSARSYFKNSKDIESGHIYMSAFELFVDRSQPVQPTSPEIRFAMPVLDARGARRGIYVINVPGAPLLADLKRADPLFANRLRILNSKGYCLDDTESDRETDSVLPGRPGPTLATDDPNFWARLTSEPVGQEARGGGLFSWRRVTSDDVAGPDAGIIFADQPFLIVASEVSPAQYAAFLSGLRQIFLFLTPALLTLVATSLWFLDSRRNAQLALRQSEESLSVTLHSIGDGVLATDTGGMVTLMNRVAERLTGWSLAEARGRPIAEVFRIVIEGTDRPSIIPVEKALATGDVQGLENHTELIARGGSRCSIADSAAPIRDPEGHILGVVLVFRDITESRKAQDELNRFFELSLDFLCISSIDGYFKRVSPAVTDILGWSVAEFLTIPFLDMVHPDDREATTREVERQVIAGERALQFENRYRHKNGSWRILSWRSVPQPGGLMYATARDVTELRNTDNQIRQLNDDLQRNAAQMEATNRELEAFSYSVSHDLRAPLRHVQGYVEMLVAEAGTHLSEKANRYLKTIAEAGNEMGVLIDDLLSFSRMGRTELREAEVDLGMLVAEVRAGLELATQGRKINWSISGLPRVLGDYAMLRQVFANVLGNAVKYTRLREVAEIEIGCSGEEAGRVVLFIRDNGVGFDMKYADKLFGVFQRLHRSDEFEGTGIGLANVHRIILRHGGRIWAQAALNEGAWFYFTLKPAKPITVK
jgi:PAS domain S-box-containing protein